jgi:hypothetical protein
MTASVGREIERTFSRVARYLTGLASTEAHKAGRQNIGDLVEPLGGCHQVGPEGVGAGERTTHGTEVVCNPSRQRTLGSTCWGSQKNQQLIAPMRKQRNSSEFTNWRKEALEQLNARIANRVDSAIAG